MFYNILIPMAGEGSRFGYKFKPLLKLDDRTFIEHVLDSFIVYNESILYYYFIITKEQEEKYNVSQSLNIIFNKIKHKIKILYLAKKTDGPYQSIINGIREKIDNVIICDCDHKIIINPIIELLETNKDIDIIIPIWDIKPSEYNNWGKVLVDNNVNINYYEKENVLCKNNEKLYGIIGCYYFKSTTLLDFKAPYINMSNFFKSKLYTNLNIINCKINDAYFFGTPKMVEQYIEIRRTYENVICDIDGVLFKHNPHSNTNEDDITLIGNCSDKLLEWKKQNKKIILMTARSKNTEKDLIQLLKNKNIYYDELIMGVNPGTRYVVNDIKPSHIFTKQAVVINLIRDNGITHLNLEENINNNINIIQKLKGGSFSTTYLLENDNKKIIKKYIIKTNEDIEHYYKLKRQCDDLKRFNYYCNNIVPNILNEVDTSFDYYYDMNYLENYEQLNMFNSTIQKKVTICVLDKLNKNIYCYKKELNEYEKKKFMDDYLNNKIYCKLDKFEKSCNIMDYLINSNQIQINGDKYYGLRRILKEINVYNYSPNFLCPIHGDLTYENILYNYSNDDIKLIDMEGSQYVDTPLFDLGKLFQSVVSQYEVWSNLDNIILDDNINNLKCNDTYFNNDKDISFLLEKFKTVLMIDNIELINKYGIFYMGNIFIRFIPFRLKVNKNQGIFALIMAIVWFNKLNI